MDWHQFALLEIMYFRMGVIHISDFLRLKAMGIAWNDSIRIQELDTPGPFITKENKETK